MRRPGVVALLALSAALAACEPVVETLTPLETIDCQGVPAQQCQEAVDQARGVSRAQLVRVVVRCSAPPCTEQAGQVDVQALYTDGNTSGWSSAWEALPAIGPDVGAQTPGPAQPAGVPDGPLPVKPACLGVPEAKCIDMAWAAIFGLPADGPAIRAITLRCTTVCTPTKAEGVTTVVFADGTSILQNWGYEGGG